MSESTSERDVMIIFSYLRMDFGNEAIINPKDRADIYFVGRVDAKPLSTNAKI